MCGSLKVLPQASKSTPTKKKAELYATYFELLMWSSPDHPRIGWTILLRLVAYIVPGPHLHGLSRELFVEEILERRHQRRHVVTRTFVACHQHQLKHFSSCGKVGELNHLAFVELLLEQCQQLRSGKKMHDFMLTFFSCVFFFLRSNFPPTFWWGIFHDRQLWEGNNNINTLPGDRHIFTFRGSIQQA